MDSRFLASVREIVGSDNLDEQQIVYPRKIEQIVALVGLANQFACPLYPMGFGSSIRKLLPKFEPGLKISMQNFQEVIEYRPSNLSIEVEAGLSSQQLREYLLSDNLFLPIEMSNTHRSIGGLVASNAYGRKRFLYQSTRCYVLGLEFISPTGQIIRVGGRTVKDTSGYDISQMLAGSWGTLGLITKVTLGLRPLPEKNLLLQLPDLQLNQIQKMGQEILASKIDLASLIFILQNGQYNLYLELEGFQKTIAGQVKDLQQNYSWQQSSTEPNLKVYNSQISVPRSKYIQLLTGLECLKQNFALEQGNMTNGLLEGDFLGTDLSPIKSLVQQLNGTLIYQGQQSIGPSLSPAYLNLLRNLKKQIDPQNIFFPEIIAKGVARYG